VNPLAIVQARTSSTRLPGKVLADVGGEPMLALLLRRLRHARTLAGIVVATSDRPDDAPVAELARDLEVEVHRGSLTDALGRFIGALGDRPGPVVRITGDCPLVDAAVVDAAVDLFASAPGLAYASNVDPHTYPDGLDVEVVARDALIAIDGESLDTADREHVTAAVRRDPERFPARNLRAEDDLSGLQWSVDTADDLAFVRAVVKRLGDRRHTADRHEVLAAVRTEPSLAGFAGSRG
jgi:spore coat polysaccharide biosynthesis protein SpsF (cytidylyltransferase family)